MHFQKIEMFFTMHYYLFIFRILGLAPFAVNVASLRQNHVENPEKPVSISHIGSIYNIFMSCFTCFLCIKNFKAIFSVNISSLNMLTKMVGSYFNIMGYVLIIIIWLSFIQRQAEVVSLGNTILDIYRRIGELTKIKGLPRKLMLKMVWQLIISTIVITNIFIIIDFSILIAISYCMPTVIINYTLMQYSFILDIIGYGVDILNSLLKTLGEIKTTLPLFVRKNHIPNDVQSRLSTVRMLHHQLIQISHKVTNFYAIPLFLGIPFFLVMIIYSTYFVLLPFMNQTEAKTIMYFNGFGLIIAQSTPVIFVAISATQLKEVIKQTANVIHIILDNCICSSSTTTMVMVET